MHIKISISALLVAAIYLFFNAAVYAESVTVPLITDGSKLTADFHTKEWGKAAVFDEFASARGDVPTVKTKLYLMHDKDNLYIGFECLGQDQNQLIVNSRYLPEGDAVAFALDSFNDGLGSYVFLSNPKGDRLNAVISDGQPELHFSFRTEFSTLAKYTAHGYNTIMIIPFKNFPFYWKSKVLMNFKAARFINKNKEMILYPYIMMDRIGDAFSHAQSIQINSISQVDYKKPWFSVDSIYQNRKKFAKGYDLNTYMGRGMVWGVSTLSVADYKIMPYHKLYPSKTPKNLSRNLRTKWVEQQLNDIDYYPNRKIKNLDHFLKRTQTTSFIVVHNDKIIYEKYFNGFKQDSIATSFSMAKSFLSALIGIAVSKKQIHSIDDPITNYLPELSLRDKRFARIAIKDLLSMSPGIRVINEDPYYDGLQAYWAPNLRHILLNTLSVLEPPGCHFNYHDYFAQLAGLVLIRATHQTATQLLQSEIWDQLGMPYGGSWSIDSDKDDLEQLAVGINTSPINYAKFGLLFLHKGKYAGKQIVPAHWVEISTQPNSRPLGYYPNDWTGNGVKKYYKYFWWGIKRAGKKDNENDYAALGHRGQFIYISPQKNLVIVRTGMDSGITGNAWEKIFYEFASKF